MVLDGVSNAESYFNDIFQWGRDGMADTHKVGFLLCVHGKQIDTDTHPDTYRIPLELCRCWP